MMKTTKGETERKGHSRFAFAGEDPTSFHEKMSWVMLGGVFVGGVLFIGVLVRIGNQGGFADGFTRLDRGDIGGLLIAMTFLLVAAAIIGAIISALVNLADADEPVDEREQRIRGKAARIADPVTGSFLFGTLMIYFADASSSLMACGIILAIWAGTFADYLARCIFYRIS